MKIVLVAGDYAQSEVLSMFAKMLERAGHDTMSFLGYGKKNQFTADSVKAFVKDASWLVAGMSERSDEEVVAVQEAMRRNIPFALYADTFGAHRLPAFTFARDLEFRLFVINDKEAGDASNLFPRADVYVTGNPRWEEFAFPRLSRGEARSVLGIEDNRRVILCPGDKSLAQNMIQFGATIDAVHKLKWARKTDIVIGLHPGDPNDPKLYDELVERAGCVVRIIGRHVGISTSDILVGCDLVVEFTSTIGIQAACLRIPVIDFCSTIAMGGKSPVEGEDPWRLVKGGASMPIYFGSSEALAVTMSRLDHLGETSLLRTLLNNQEHMFPVPPKNARGQAIRLMCGALGA